MKIFKNSKKNKGGLWNATLGELIASLAVLEKYGFTVEMLKQLRENNGPEKAKKIVAICLEPVAGQSAIIQSDYAGLIKDWEIFSEKYFGLKVDLSGVKIPIPAKDFNRLIIIIPEITINKVVAVQRNYFKTWVYAEELDDVIITHNDRDAANGAYAIWVRDDVEPDNKYRNRSANWITDNKISGETLLERLIHGLKYWDEAKKHLDIKGITLCSGSRYSDGGVPSVSFDPDDGRVHVRWYRPVHVSVGLGVREIVSCAS